MSNSEQIRELINSLDASDIGNIASLFAYQGFSADLVLAHLLGIKTGKKISDREFKSDLKHLLVASVVMGNVTKNNIDKISSEGRQKIDNLMMKYDIKKGSISNAGKKAVTLPRLAATFPIQISKFQLGINEKNYNNELGASSLPACFKVSVFPSLIPKSFKIEIQHALLVISNAYSTEQSLAIGKKKDISIVYREQWNFTNIAFNSSMPKDSDRFEYINQLTFDFDSMKTVFAKVYNTISDIEPKAFPSHETWKEELEHI
uniref:Nucleocapsid n=1 Tax=Uromyces fabae virus TaxID=3069272 RepID=A0AA51UA44_9VIRU|nr:nucleocapsid [Uromyces fabae virus]